MNKRHSGEKKVPSELAIRIVSAIAMITAALLTAWIGGWIFALFWVAAAIAIFWEWTRMSGVGSLPNSFVLLCLAGIALSLLAFVPHLPAGFGGILVPFAAVLALLCAYLGRTTRDKKWIIGGAAYAAVIAFFPNFLRQLAPHGLSNILWVFAVVWATDIAAYFVGRALGGPKLWPRVSPNKTWSGFCGGLAAGTIAGLVVVLFLQRGTSHLHWGLIGLFSAISSVLSQGGDLAESALKRRFGFKDSSFLIPGHGGVMDRLDGFWAAVFFLGMCLVVTHAMHNWAA